MKRKLTAMALTLVMALTLLVPAAGAASFPDVPSNHWASDYIARADQSGWMNGYPDGTFRPEAQVTGAEFLTMVTRAFVPGDIPLKAAGDQWYAPYLVAADQHGLRDGAQLSTAKALDAPASRYQMAAILANLLTAAGIHAGPNFEPALLIGDWASIPNQWRDSVALAYCTGLLNGVDAHGTFAGGDNMKRCEAAKVLCMAYDVAGVLVPGSDPNLNQGSGTQTPDVPQDGWATTDAQLLAQAQADVSLLYNMQIGFHAGAWFDQDWTPYATVNGLPWFRVTEPGIHTMADVDAVWYEKFSRLYPTPGGYQWINGAVCSSNQGIGDDPTLDKITVDKVLSRTADTAVLQGWAYHWNYNWTASYPEGELRCVLTWEDGQWKCSQFELTY